MKLLLFIKIILPKFQFYSIDFQYSIENHQMKYGYLLLLALMFTTASTLEWYQQGNSTILDWNNFYTAVSESNKYKFVKYFTHSCRYCRMLKQVQEELQKQRKWIFEFYEVDCTLHYDLCSAKAAPSAFPFVGIYNLKGEMEAQIGGFYPLDTMREAFHNIEQRQIEALKLKGINVQIPPNAQMKNKFDQKNNAHQEQKQNHPTKEPKANKLKNSQEGQNESITQGIKILLVLFGVWLYQKQIRPFLTEKNSDKTRVIEMPAFSAKSQHSQTSRLLKDTL